MHQIGRENIQFRVRKPSSSPASIGRIANWKSSICKTEDCDYTGKGKEWASCHFPAFQCMNRNSQQDLVQNLQRTPENGNTLNGESKPVTVREILLFMNI